MSSLTATRTPRLTPPAAPTRKATPRRRTLGRGASLVGRAGRPVLRIVADVEQAPVVTRVAPEPDDLPPRRVAIEEFFAAEYDGDEQVLEFGVSLAATIGLGLVAATGSLADDQPEPTRVVTVQPGQTLWDIASGVSRGDVRSTMAHLEAINHLDSTTLQVGQHLRVPQ